MALMLALLACGDEGTTPIQEIDALEIPEGCNPLAFEHDCLLPFPSDVFVEGTGSQRRVTLGQASGIQKDDGTVLEAFALHPAAGFSTHPTLLAHFKGGVRADELAFHEGDAPLTTLAPQSATLIINAETGQPVLHFAELDPRAETPEDQALILRPMVRLDDDTRYIVALQGLRDPQGQPIEAPEGFARLRDARGTAGSRLEALAARYDADVFEPLERFGVARKSLLLAWDFTTRPRADATADLLAVRADVLAKLARTPPPVTLEPGVFDEGQGVYHFDGTMEVPLYLKGEEPRFDLCRDAGGAVEACGVLEVPLVVSVPAALIDAPVDTPARVVQFGHGFFGTRAEVTSGAAARFINHTGAVMVGINWFGMDNRDGTQVATDIVMTPETALRFVDRLHQGFANQLALTRAIETTLAEALQPDGAPLYDPSRVYYYGLSNGHILGGTFVALSPTIDTAAMGVGGAAFSLIMFRSLNFLPFEFLLRQTVSSVLEQQKWASLAQLTLDRIDPITYAPWLANEQLPDGPPSRRVLFQTGVGDASVPGVAAHLHARALGLPLLTPAPRKVAGMTEAPYPAAAGVVEFDFGLPAPLPGTAADFPDGPNEIHEGIRQLPEALDQLDAFFRPDGAIPQTCDGPCDPQ